MPFKTIDKQRINPTAAPDAMKGSGVANWVRAALAPDENRDGRTDIGGFCKRVGQK